MIRILGEFTELLASHFYFLKTVRAENMVNFLATPKESLLFLRLKQLLGETKEGDEGSPTSLCQPY